MMAWHPADTLGSMSNLLTRREVESRFGISKTTIYRLMRSGEFPEPVRVGVRAVRWPEAEIAEWLKGRPRSQGDRADRAGKAVQGVRR